LTTTARTTSPAGVGACITIGAATSYAVMSTSLHSSSPDSATAGAAPGWYQDPAAPGQQRFWDGKVWTAQVVQSGMQSQTVVSAGASGGLVVAGWLCAVLFPIGGIILAQVIKNADKGTGRARGAWILGVSLVFLAITAVIFMAAASSTSSDYSYSYGY
jgi:Protein of unknown function (DUF2510)